MAQAVTEIRVWQEGAWRWLPATSLRFAYRSLDLPPGAVVTAVRLRLRREEASRVRDRMDEAIARRRATQPRLPSLGCWFRNPDGDSAGRLIDAAGLKGARVGGAVVSPVHANFLVREGAATAADFLALAEKVKSAVAAHSGVTLQEEIHVAR
jgi:UDP-N-acetylmuramate dehydrogenase